MPDIRVTSQQKQAVFERAKGCCEYCRSQVRFATQPFSMDHILPRSQGGETTLENLALACQGCNNHQYTKTEARDPVTGDLVKFYHPRNHKWKDHFTWSNDFTLIVGLSPIARATIESLKLNREELVNLRRILNAMGEHPPEEETD